MKRALSLAAAALAVTGVVSLAPGAQDGACAQGDAVVPKADCENPGAGPAPTSCTATTAFRSVSARRSGRGVRLAFARRGTARVRIDVFQVSKGRRVLGQRLVARFKGRTTAVRWNGRDRRGRRLGNGLFFARFTLRDARGRTDVRRVTLARRAGRFSRRRAFYRRASCATLAAFKLERPAFGGRGNRALGISFRLARAGFVTVEVRRAGRDRVVRRYAARSRAAGVTHRLRLGAERLPRGLYEVRLLYAGESGAVRGVLYARRL